MHSYECIIIKINAAVWVCVACMCVMVFKYDTKNTCMLACVFKSWFPRSEPFTVHRQWLPVTSDCFQQGPASSWTEGYPSPMQRYGTKPLCHPELQIRFPEWLFLNWLLRRERHWHHAAPGFHSLTLRKIKSLCIFSREINRAQKENSTLLTITNFIDICGHCPC